MRAAHGSSGAPHPDPLPAGGEGAFIRFLFFVLFLSGCAPDFVDEPWRITGRRIIAVVAEPPEAAPGASVTFQAIVAGGSGASVRWSRCDEARPPTQNAPVADGCVTSASSAPPSNETANLELHPRACFLFGSGVAAASDRPREPDPTGGWYQPFGAALDGDVTFAFERLHCEPAGISLDVSRAYAARWRPNENPRAQLAASRSGTRVTLTATWEEEEAYVAIDPVMLGLVERREEYVVSWFTTAGTLPSARTSSGTTTLTLDEGTTATVWAIVRDGRGGSAALSTHIP